MSEQNTEEKQSKVLLGKKQGYTISFEISPDSLECRASYTPSGMGGTPMNEAELALFMKQYKIIEEIQPQSVENLLHAAATGIAANDILLAIGKPMRTGKNGYIKLAVTPPEVETAAAEEEESLSDQVDFRQVQVFLNVEPNDLVGTIIPPESGTDGKNIHGQVIPAKAGTLLNVKLGKNIRLADDQVSLYATAAGRIYCKGSDISVEDVYTVSGDVDFKVGNIQFKGFAEIKGDVLDGFSVKADKGIKIHGNAGVSTLESDGDIAICGMNGQGKGTITCGGTFSANFIYDTDIECDGDVLVDTEIRNCNISSLGMVKIAKGGLAGGDCIALGGVESAVIGTVTSLKTKVIAGVHYRDLIEINRLFAELKQLIEELKTSSTATQNLTDFSVRKMAITKQIQEIRARVYDNSNPKVNVKKHLYEGVTIVLGSLTEQVKEERDGAMSIIENTIEGGFRYLGMTALEFKAADIEKSFILQAEREKAAARQKQEQMAKSG